MKAPHSPSKPSKTSHMAKIGSRDTAPELVVRRFLFAKGFRFRVQQRLLSSRVDIVLKKWNCCIFINGCFWHRHAGCRHATFPKTNKAFWQEKFARNLARDRGNLAELMAAGWNVGVIWECTIRSGEFAEAGVADLIVANRDWEIG